jgi:hypothetical protein
VDVAWWVRAEQPTALVSDYANLAAALGLPEAGQADRQLVVLAVRRWLGWSTHPQLFRLERRTWLSFSLGFATVGLVLTLRRPANPIGWL